MVELKYTPLEEIDKVRLYELVVVCVGACLTPNYLRFILLFVRTEY